MTRFPSVGDPRRPCAPLGLGALLLAAWLLGLPSGARAAADPEVPSEVSGQPTWAWHAAQQARRAWRTPDRTAEPAPATIPGFETFPNPDGLSATFQPGGDTTTALQAFFSPLGTNARTC